MFIVKKEVKYPYADEAVIVFDSDVERDRFLDLTIGHNLWKPDADYIPEIVRLILDAGSIYYEHGRTIYLNGTLVLKGVYGS